jgi:hypothetical protein
MIRLKYFRNTSGPEKKDILTLLAVGTLIGLFICGIPLAVMSTLYLEASKFNGRHIVLYIQFHIESQSQTTSSTVSPETSESKCILFSSWQNMLFLSSNWCNWYNWCNHYYPAFSMYFVHIKHRLHSKRWLHWWLLRER